MYKCRIRDWNIDKKLKREDVINILRAYDLCLRQNRACDFILRGYPVNMQTVRRYVRRNGLTPAQWTLPPNASWSIPEYLQCTTPIQPHVSLPDVQQTSEQLLYEAKAYFETCFSNGTWSFSRGGTVIVYSNRFPKTPQHHFHETFQLARHFHTSDPARAGALTRSGFLLLEHIIRYESADLLARVVSEVGFFHRKALHWIAQSLAAQAARLSAHYLSTEHPLRHIFHLLARVPAEGVKSLDCALSNIQLNSAASAAKEENQWIFRRRLELLFRNVMENPQLDVRRIFPDVAALQSSYGDTDRKVLETLSNQADAFVFRRDWPGVRDVGKELVRLAQSLDDSDPGRSSPWAAQGWFFAGMAYFHLSKDDEAEEFLLAAWKTVSIATDNRFKFGTQERAELCDMLSRIALDDGRAEEAGHWQKQYYQTVDGITLTDQIEMQLDST